MKKAMAAPAAFACLALAGAAARADDGLSANVSLTSKYKYRGQDQSDPDKDVLPAIQGGFDYALGSFYVGNWNSSIGFGGDTEMDFYGGYRGQAGKVGYDIGVLQYYYPGDSDYNTTESYGGVSYGIASAKLSYVVSDKYFGATDSSGTLYLDLSANYEIAKGLTSTATSASPNWPAARPTARTTPTTRAGRPTTSATASRWPARSSARTRTAIAITATSTSHA